VGIVSDIHGNFHALKEVDRFLRERKVDEVWCLGDIVGYGAFPNECVEWVRENCTVALLGNHELGVLGFYDLNLIADYAAMAIVWTREVLKEDNLEYLKRLPIQHVNRFCQLVHDTPENPGSMEYILSERDAYGALLNQKRNICFFGHTHVPAGYRLWASEVDRVSLKPLYLWGGKYLLNPGSVGQPRDRDPRASVGIFDYKEGTFSVHRIEYDTKAAAREILRAGLPEFLAARLMTGE